MNTDYFLHNDDYSLCLSTSSHSSLDTEDSFDDRALFFHNMEASRLYFKANWRALSENMDEYPIYAYECVNALATQTLDRCSDEEYETIRQTFQLARSICELNNGYHVLQYASIERMREIFNSFLRLFHELQLTPLEEEQFLIPPPFQHLIDCLQGNTLDMLDPVRFTFQQKIDIARDLIAALKDIHDRGLSHATFHEGHISITLQLPSRMCASMTEPGTISSPDDELLTGASVDLPWTAAFLTSHLCTVQHEDNIVDNATHAVISAEVDAMPPFPISHTIQERGRLASILYKLFFYENMSHTTFKSQEARLKMEQYVTPDSILPLDEAIRFILLRMMAWPQNKAYSLETALVAFNKLATTDM